MSLFRPAKVMWHFAVIALAAGVVFAQVDPASDSSVTVTPISTDASAVAAAAAPGGDPAVAITAQQAASRSRQCSSCTGSPIAPVCAEVGGISVTVASRCIAECQQLSNIRQGTCEDLASGIDASCC